MKKKLSLSKKTLRNLSVRSGVNTGGTIALTHDGCGVVTSSAIQTADCDMLSLKPIRSVPSSFGTFKCSIL